MISQGVSTYILWDGEQHVPGTSRRAEFGTQFRFLENDLGE
jgi:hypothetical protein